MKKIGIFWWNINEKIQNDCYPCYFWRLKSFFFYRLHKNCRYNFNFNTLKFWLSIVSPFGEEINLLMQEYFVSHKYNLYINQIIHRINKFQVQILMCRSSQIFMSVKLSYSSKAHSSIFYDACIFLKFKEETFWNSEVGLFFPSFFLEKFRCYMFTI